MQRARLTFGAAALTILVSAGGVARAQFPGGGGYRPGNLGQINRPTYSPYLNLLRNGNSTLQNYYGLVRPELDIRNAAANLQQQSLLNEANLNNYANQNNFNQVLVTGHSATFLNTGGYFLNRGGRSVGGGFGRPSANGLAAPGLVNGPAPTVPGLITSGTGRR